MGAEHFMSENPPFGATLTYFLKEGYKSSKKIRKEKEEKAKEKKIQIPLTNWATLDKEMAEEKDQLWMVIEDAEGDIIRKISCPSKKGFNKVTWDLRHPSTTMIELKPRKRGEWDNAPKGILAAPGKYSAFLMQESQGSESILTESIDFNVKPLYESAEGTDSKTTAAFWKDYAELVKNSSILQAKHNTTTQKLSALKRATQNTTLAPSEYAPLLKEATSKLQKLESRMSGSKAKREIGEKTIPTMGDRLFALYIGLSNSTYGPTKTHLELVKWVEVDMEQFSGELKGINEDIKTIAKKIADSGGPI